eukprot:4727150-Heterocapsa_arctica.AAC.1
MHLYLLIDVSTWCPPRRRTRVARSGACLKHYMDFVNRQGSSKIISRRSLVRTAGNACWQIRSYSTMLRAVRFS